MRVIAVLILILVTGSAFSQEIDMIDIPRKSITLDALEEMFENIQENTEWDTSENMLWGYFFTHREPALLERAKSYLTAQDYMFVGIYLGDKEDKNEPDTYWLHVEKAETHSPKTLDARNDEFYVYAHKMGIDSYDGMDIGPVEN